MQKTILITGSTDGIGLKTAKTLVSLGHNVLIHGRNFEKVKEVEKSLKEISSKVIIQSYIADLSNLKDVINLAKNIMSKHKTLDIIINNAGIYKTANSVTEDGLDVRFVVNSVAPYFLTKLLIPLFHKKSRIINLSSAAQASVNIDAMLGKVQLNHGEAYAQSKLALTMITSVQAQEFKNNISSIISVNPASLLATKMVKEGYGIVGNDITIGSNILVSMALDDRFENIKGKYYDNDNNKFALPHPFGQDIQNCKMIVDTVEKILSSKFE
ncbi:SDR family NAD(P)-dependent oxidoreductase [Arcobacter sp. s6]|jgi:NAD(P)-dependent dehydrogenase (short-subunit alcohol dehydrogenase family)|uniref:SDR family NAD(P)-dependent oxidoreductase n=1 Tax=Arcobacter sp. s6 TaxID=3230363 RepID=UPI00349FD85C